MRAAAWITLYLALVALPMLVLFLGDVPPGVAFWWDLSKALGFAAVSMIGVQFILTGRFRAPAYPFGIDIIYFLHRYLAIIAAALAFAHFAIMWLLYEDALGVINPLEAPWYMTLGRVGLVTFILAVVTSEWREQLGLKYEWWRLLHIFLAMTGFLAAVAHILGVGYYTAAPTTRALWLSLTLSWLLLIIWVRIVRPSLLRRRPYRVRAVRSETGEVSTLVLEPDGHSGLRNFQPGQFVWLTLGRSPFAIREHPFSLSSAPHQLPEVAMTIRELGDFTQAIPSVPEGEIAYLDGPFGIFSHHRLPRAPGFVYIVGGVGITPVISMLRAMAQEGERRPLWLFYANPAIEQVIFREELDELAGQLDLTLIHILQEPPEEWAGETGMLTREMLDKHLPSERIGKLHYFLCGPPPMLEAAEEHLDDMGVPRRHVHVEIFNL
jgi:predicted ferric reductase